MIPLQPLDKDDGKYSELSSRSEDRAGEPQEDDSEVKEAEGKVYVTTRRWKRVSITVATLLGYAFLNTGISMISPFYPIVAKNHNVATYVVGFVIGVAPLSMAVLSPLIGYFLPHLGMKFTQLAGLFLAGGSLILFGFVSMMPTPTLFTTFSLLLRVVEGTGSAMFYTASYTLVIQLYQEKRATIVGMMQLSASLGYCIGPPIGGGLLEAGGFKLPFLVIGGCIIILLLFLLVLVRPTDCKIVKLPWKLALKLFSNIPFVLLVVSLVLTVSAQCAILAYLGQFLDMHFNLRVGIIGVAYLVGMSTYTIGAIVVGLLTDKLKIPRYLIIAGLLIDFVGCVFVGPAKFLTTPKLWLSILAYAVVGVGSSIALIPGYSGMHGIAKTLHKEEAVVASTLSGILVAIISAGSCLGPIVGGALVYKVGFQSMTTVYGLLLLVCAVVLITATVAERVRKMCQLANTGIKKLPMY